MLINIQKVMVIDVRNNNKVSTKCKKIELEVVATYQITYEFTQHFIDTIFLILWWKYHKF